jgi:AcrR family transcriptional regulator
LKRGEIKKVALSIFAQKGYHGSRMQEIADAVGVSKAAMYFHFKSKDELFLEVLKEQISVYKDELEKQIKSFLDETIEMSLFKIVKVFVNNSTAERVLIWKKSVGMVVSGDDNKIVDSARKIIFKNYRDISKIILDFLISRNLDIKAPQTRRFLTSYLIFINSILDWMIQSYFIFKKDINDILLDLWCDFWNGSKLNFNLM